MIVRRIRLETGLIRLMIMEVVDAVAVSRDQLGPRRSYSLMIAFSCTDSGSTRNLCTELAILVAAGG
jgi:hypothetical protein